MTKHSGNNLHEQQTCNTVGRYAQQMKDAIDKTADSSTEHGFLICIKKESGIPIIDDYSENGKRIFIEDPYKSMYETEAFYVSHSLPTMCGKEHSILLPDKCSLGNAKASFHTHPTGLIEDFSYIDYAVAINEDETAMCLGVPRKDTHGYIKCVFFDQKNKSYETKKIKEKIVGEYMKKYITDVTDRMWNKMNSGHDVTEENMILDDYDTYVNDIISSAIEDGVVSQCSVRSNMGL